MNIVIALIHDKLDRILISQRPLHVPHGGAWEFPGGKIEANESPETALFREVKEELGLDIVEFKFLGPVDFDYPTCSLQFSVFKVSKFIGIPRCLEGQLQLKWEEKSDLDFRLFPEANRKIFDLLGSVTN